MEEGKLIEGCVRGESWAQKAMYELYAPAMMSVCQRYVCNRETARDLLHDGFIKLFAKIHTYSGTGLFAGWMRRVFVTTALEYLRHNDVLRYSIDVEKIDDQYDDNDISQFEYLSSDDLMCCIARLPDKFRTVFNMHAIEGYTYAEIAGELGFNESTSRSHYAKARRLLQKMVMKKVELLQVVGV
jgi:RNA polymerase sigma-70 factor (ECF subfamily)